MSGKGSAPRPVSVDAHTYADNWTRTFGGRDDDAVSAISGRGEATETRELRAPNVHLDTRFLMEQVRQDAMMCEQIAMAVERSMRDLSDRTATFPVAVDP